MQCCKSRKMSTSSSEGSEKQRTYDPSKADGASSTQSGPHGFSSTESSFNLGIHDGNSKSDRDSVKHTNTDGQPSPKSSNENPTNTNEPPSSRSDSHESRDAVKDHSSNPENQSAQNSSKGNSTHAGENLSTESAFQAVTDSSSNPDNPSSSNNNESKHKENQSTTCGESEPMEVDPDTSDNSKSDSKSKDESNSPFHGIPSHPNQGNNEAENRKDNRKTKEQDGKTQNREDIDQSDQGESAIDPREKDKTPSTASPNLTQEKSIEEFESENDFHQLSISQMKNLLTKASVNFKSFIDRKEYVERLQEVWKANRIELKSDGDACKICRDNPINCVFLECGHMMACVDCAHHIKECPICRQNISRVIRVFQN